MYRYLLIVLVSGLMSVVSAQHGVGAGWGDRVELPLPQGSNSVRGFLYKNSVAFSNNKRVIFMNNEDTGGGIYYTYSYDGKTWSDPVQFKPVNVPGINSTKIYRDNRDRLHVVWARPKPKALYYTQMDSALNVVIDSMRIASSPRNNSYNGVYLTVDLNDRLHVMWHEGDSKTEITECYYSRSTDSGESWSAPQLISKDDGKASAFPRGQFGAYGGDSLMIAWRDNVSFSPENWDLHFVTSTDGGVSWSEVTNLNSSSDFQGDPDVVVDPGGRIHMVYHQYPQSDPYNGMRIVYGYSDDFGKSWKPSPQFKNVISDDSRSELAEGTHYQISTGTLWTFWKDESERKDGGGINIKTAYSTDRGESWSTPEYITDFGNSPIGFKAILVLPDGSVGLNYEVPNYPDSGLYRVFYRERTPVVTAIKEPDVRQPRSFTLAQNSPNPFNPSTVLSFTLKRAGEVRLSVYDVRGRRIKTLVRGWKNAGVYRVTFEAGGLAAGVYYYRLVSGGESMVKKMILLP